MIMFNIRTAHRIFRFICLFTISFLSISSSYSSGSSLPPFQPGEKLTYILKWEVIPAGEAILEVLPVKRIKGITVYHFTLSAKSNSFVDFFYKVRDKIDAFADIGMHHTLHYTKKQHEGSTRRDVVVEFDWQKNEAQYTNYGKKMAPISIPDETFDPLSAFYYSRFLDLEVNTLIKRHVTDGKKIVLGTARVVRKEQINLDMGTYDTYLLEPEIKDIGGVFAKSRNAKIQIWVTADHRRLPVRIKSKVVVGSFTGELIAAEGLK